MKTTTKAKLLYIFLSVNDFLSECHGYSLNNIDDLNTPDFPVNAIAIENYSQKGDHVEYPSTGTDFDTIDQSSLDTWSVVWYIASFGGLILFFLIVSCSEWCCRQNARRQCQRNNNASQVPVPQVVLDTPPPSYDHFAPPAYEDLWAGRSGSSRRNEKTEYDIYVVPVHAFSTFMSAEGVQQSQDAPPSYQCASAMERAHT